MRAHGTISRHIQDTVDAFAACTALPIAALTLGGHVLAYGGNQLPGSLGTDTLRIVCAKTVRSMQGGNTLNWPLQYSLGPGAEPQLTVVPIDTRDHSRGIFIIGPLSRSQLHACVHFLVGLLRSIQEHAHRPVPAFPANLHVRRAVRYVHEHYREPVSLESTARLLGINKSYLAQVFRAEMGETFTEFVNRLRVEMSKQALQDSDEPVVAIALRHGFTSQNYYGRVFKKLTGMTPSEFRKQLRAQDFSLSVQSSASDR